MKKTKFLAKMMLLVLLMTSAVSLSACRDPNCVKGDFYTSSNTQELDSVIKVVSKTKCFELDNITFDLYIGLKEIKVFLSSNNMNDISQNDLHTVNKESKESYYVVAVTTDDVFYAYDTNADFYQYVYNNMTILKEISVKDEEKFPYIKKWSGRDIGYCESITISKDLIKNNTGKIILILGKVFEVEGSYFVTYSRISKIKLSYTIDQENVIRLSFSGYEKY